MENNYQNLESQNQPTSTTSEPHVSANVTTETESVDTQEVKETESVDTQEVKETESVNTQEVKETESVNTQEVKETVTQKPVTKQAKSQELKITPANLNKIIAAKDKAKELNKEAKSIEVLKSNYEGFTKSSIASIDPSTNKTMLSFGIKSLSLIISEKDKNMELRFQKVVNSLVATAKTREDSVKISEEISQFFDAEISKCRTPEVDSSLPTLEDYFEKAVSKFKEKIDITPETILALNKKKKSEIMDFLKDDNK